jgi:hypothetical protein
MLLGGLIGTTAALALAGVAVLPGWLLLPARSSESPASSGSSSSGQWGCGLGHVTTARVCYGIHVAAGACENMSAVGLSQISLRASGCGTLFCSFVLSDPKITAQKGFRAIQDFRQAERQPVQPPQASTRGDQSPAVNSKGDTAIGYGAPPGACSRCPTFSGLGSMAFSRLRPHRRQSVPGGELGGNVGIQYDPPASQPPASGR